jgi:hypothetical protein
VISTDIELKQLRIYDLESLTASTFWNESGAWNVGGAVGSPLLSNVEQRIDIPSGDFACWGFIITIRLLKNGQQKHVIFQF